MDRKTLKVKGSLFEVKKFLGKGKSGYSYLIENQNNSLENYVLKQIHDEPCAYYTFGDKLKAEIHSYYKLKTTGIRIPELIEYNEKSKYLVKEFIDGETASDMIAQNRISINIFRELFEIAQKAKINNLNLDYFPTNFIIADNSLCYIDYELNEYTKEWNLQNWGIYYWLNSEGMNEYLRTHNLLKLNIDLSSGKPIKHPFEKKAAELIKEFTKRY